MDTAQLIDGIIEFLIDHRDQVVEYVRAKSTLAPQQTILVDAETVPRGSIGERRAATRRANELRDLVRKEERQGNLNKFDLCKKKRLECDFCMVEAAALIDMSVTYVSRLESGYLPRPKAYLEQALRNIDLLLEAYDAHLAKAEKNG